jgi:hypothetical protein
LLKLASPFLEHLELAQGLEPGDDALEGLGDILDLRNLFLALAVGLKVLF